MGAIVRLPPDIVSTPVFLQQGETVDWSLTLAGIPDLWKITKGKGIKVGILDSGCDLNHPDLKDAIDVAKDFTNSRFGAMDRNGHGCLHPGGLVYTSFCGLETIETLYGRVDRPEEVGEDGSTIKRLDDLPVYTVSVDAGSGHTVRDRVTALHRIPVHGDVVRVQHSEGETLLTPWHPCYVQRRPRGVRTVVRLRADELKPGDFLCRPGRESPGVRDDNVLLAGRPLGAREAYLAGLLCSDGHFVPESKLVCLTNKNRRILDLAAEILATFGGQVRRYVDGRTGCEDLRHRRAWDFYEALGIGCLKAERPIVPDLIAKSPREVIVAYLAGYIDGDGSVDHGRARIITGDQAKARKLVQLVRVLGGSASCAAVPAHGKFSAGFQVRLSLDGLSDFGVKCASVRPKNRGSVSVVEVSHERYDGDFFDFTTERHHNYVGDGVFISNTHTSGTIAARADGQGVIGVLPECRLHVYKVLDDSGAGSSDGIARAMDEAAADGCDLINCSFGAGFPDPLMQAANRRIAGKGVWVICAAGNNGGQPGYPAAWNFNVAVAAYQRDGQPAPFSSHGAAVDIGAYGVDIVSCAPGGGYQKMSGTSMACPFVTGVSGLYWSRLLLGDAHTAKPGVTQLIAKLKEGASDPGQAGTGGLINPGKVVQPIGPGPVVPGDPGRGTLIGQWGGFGLYSPARAGDLFTFSIGPVDGA